MKCIKSRDSTYIIEKRIGGNSRFTLYSCSRNDKKDTLILKIAKHRKNNPELDREAVIIKDMSLEAELTQKEYEKIDGNEGKYLNYHYFFPILLESFVLKEESDRRVSVFDFSHISTKISELVPASFVISKEKLRIDPRTSAWVLGKLLKLIDFTHNQKISIGNLSLDNILINREQHYVTVFDWSQSKRHAIPLREKEVVREISHITKGTVSLLGGDPKKGSIPGHIQLLDKEYEKLLKRLLFGEITSANRAHKDFYNLILSLWPTEFHSYTTY